jgi:hypothetical protein
MAAVQTGDQDALDAVLSRQRTHLLRELRALAEARAQAPTDVVGLLITAAELHARADLGVVDAAEQNLRPARAAAGAARAAATAAAPPAGASRKRAAPG